ncbi:MAG: ABC transporter substrate-binding protein [Chloroflexi bacterium]|nr:ABC transporter substrate-binding protein [Chloroflexota bacterium]
MKVTAIDGGIVSNISFYEGIDKGYYQAEGLDVSLVSLPDASTSAQMIATNQAQFYIAIPDPVIFNALARGINVRVLVSTTTNKPTDRPAALLVRQDLIDSGRYKTPADLKGMTIAAGAASAQFYVQRALTQGGLTLADVNLVNIGALPDILAALQNKSVDAGWEVEPLITQAERSGVARAELATGQLYPGAVGGALIMAPSFEQDHPEAALRFLIAYLRGQRDYYHALNKRDTDATPVIQSLTAHTLVKDPSLYQVMGLPSLDPNGAMDPSVWDPFQDFYVRQGILERKIDLTPYLDTSLVNAALERLGHE